MRKRRTKAQVEAFETELHAILESDYPQSVRHVFYRMTDPRLSTSVDKTEKGYRQVQNRLSLMRRRGAIPYGWISDATRRGYHTETFSGPRDFLERMKHAYRANLWTDNPNYVEVWCESRSIAGVIEDTCRRYCVSLYPSGGFSSLTLTYEAAQYINERCWLGDDGGVDLDDGDACASVIYIGDYDPAGVLIDQSVEKELRQHLTVPLDFERIAITPEQIDEYDLPTKPRNPDDRRALHVESTVEAEAMPAETLREMLAEAIEQYLPADAWQKTQVAERSERQALDLVAAELAQ